MRHLVCRVIPAYGSTPQGQVTVKYTDAMGTPLSRTVYALLCVVLLAANILTYKTIFAPHVLRVHILPAGKTSVVLVESPSGRRLLINGGSDASILRALGETLSPWSRSLDAVLITSVGAKTSGGLPLVLARYHTDLLVRPESPGSATQEKVLAGAPADHTEIGKRGTRLDLGDGAYADMLWPPTTSRPLTCNGGGLVVLLSYGRDSYLIYADDAPPRVLGQLPFAGATVLALASTTPRTTYTADGR